MNRLSFQMLSLVVLVLLSNSVAIGADFKIEKALWKAEKSVLVVKATADKGQRLRIENAYDSAQVLKESKLRKETLTARLRSPEQLPCRIRVVNLTTGREVEKDVMSSETKQTPEGCYPTSDSEPAVNKAPVANAGVDQQKQLQTGQTSLTVTPRWKSFQAIRTVRLPSISGQVHLILPILSPPQLLWVKVLISSA